MTNEVIGGLVLLGLALIVIAKFFLIVNKEGEYRVRMANSIEDTPIVRGQLRTASWSWSTGWIIRVKCFDGTNVWIRVKPDDVRNCAKKRSNF